jgi:hypothetical protein
MPNFTLHNSRINQETKFDRSELSKLSSSRFIKMIFLLRVEKKKERLCGVL